MKSKTTARDSKARTFANLDQIRAWNTQRYSMLVQGQQIRCVILGETHSHRDYIAKQTALIEVMKPQYVLHECAENWIYDPSQGGYHLPRGRKATSDAPLEQLPRLLTEQADRLGHPIIGIDLGFDEELDLVYRRLAKEQPDKFLWNPVPGYPDLGTLRKRDDPTYEFDVQDDVTVALRDAKMIEMIGHYERISDTPLVVIVGAHHAGNFHKRELLQQHGFDYVVIDQTVIES